MNKKGRSIGQKPSIFGLITLGIILLSSKASGGVITGDLSVTTATVGAST
jgi:hypothetical protein